MKAFRILSNEYHFGGSDPFILLMLIVVLGLFISCGVNVHEINNPKEAKN